MRLTGARSPCGGCPDAPLPHTRAQQPRPAMSGPQHASTESHDLQPFARWVQPLPLYSTHCHASHPSLTALACTSQLLSHACCMPTSDPSPLHPLACSILQGQAGGQICQRDRPAEDRRVAGGQGCCCAGPCCAMLLYCACSSKQPMRATAGLRWFIQRTLCWLFQCRAKPCRAALMAAPPSKPSPPPLHARTLPAGRVGAQGGGGFPG